MNLPAPRFASGPLLACAFAVHFLSGLAHCADQKEIFRRVNRAYYNLTSEGLKSFRCTVHPDWDYMLNRSPTGSAAAGIRPLLEALRFQVSVGPQGAAAISHQVNTPPPAQALADRLSLVTSGVEKVLTGFFRVLSVFSYGSFGSSDGAKIEFVDSAGEYRVTEKVAATVLHYTINRDLMIKDLSATSPQSEITMHPRFLRSEKGYLLAGYQGRFPLTPQLLADSELSVEYQEIEGLKVPGVLTVTIGLPSGGQYTRFTFDQFEIERR